MKSSKRRNREEGECDSIDAEKKNQCILAEKEENDCKVTFTVCAQCSQEEELEKLHHCPAINFCWTDWLF